MKKIISNLTTCFLVAMVVWLSFSYLEIVIRSGISNPTYSNLNIIVAMTDWNN